MIVLVTGKLGAGKTYFCVNWILKKYYRYEPEIFDYVPTRPVQIVTNIEEFGLEHISLDDAIREKGLNKVFNPDYCTGKSVVFVIDEAQNIFDRKFYDKNVFSFFQMSRHYGADILLITQDIDSLARELKHLAEYEVRSSPRSRRLNGVFAYDYRSGEEPFKQQKIRFDARVASLYKSQYRSETMKVPKTYTRYIFIAIACLLLCTVGFKIALSFIYPNKAAAVSTAQKIDTPDKYKGRNVSVDNINVEESISDSSSTSRHKSDVQRLWGGDDSIEVVYDKSSDQSYYVLKEGGQFKGYVKIIGSPVRVAGIDCRMSDSVCNGAIEGSKIANFCKSCGRGLLPAPSEVAHSGAHEREGKAEEKGKKKNETREKSRNERRVEENT